MSVSGSEYSSEDEEFRDDMRVFLRLRPINKLEQSRRSKNCIELHEDPTLVTVDSPLEGEYDYTFDHVFEEYATQEEVFEHAIADIPISLMEGFNCTCIAYGQTGTGKTHTMLGADGGAHGLLQRSSRYLSRGEDMVEMTVGSIAGDTTKETPNESEKVEAVSTNEGTSESEGMIPRTISSLFSWIRKSKPTTEFIIRVSYVEIYLEKILDLLSPQGSGGSITLEDDEEPDKAAGTMRSVRIKGASELCCLDEADVFALLARGNACRTISSTDMNTESSRSHAIFVLRLEQRDTLTAKIKSSMLHMVDLAGSELGSKEASKRSSMAATMSAVHSEALMINKSLSALNKLIRAQVAHQKGEDGVPLEDIARQSKLSRLLRPSFGGNCLTTLILTASPSSYNIGETINTINFGQRCRRIFNEPVQNLEEETSNYYRTQLNLTKSNFEDAMALVRALADECLRMKAGESTGTGPLWDTITHLGRKNEPPVNFKVSIIKVPSLPREGDNGAVVFFANEQVQLQDEIEALKEEIEILSRHRLEAEGHLAELHSEVAVLRTQNENLTADKKRNVEELVNAKNEVQALSQRKLEVEHNLRTSQFRENEAIVFLRQFRRFYRNVLRDKASHGAGSISAIMSEITSKVPNAPDLGELRDIDCLLVESGLLEEYEVESDKASGSYLPSKAALMRSASAAQRAAAVESEQAIREADDEGGTQDEVPASEAITRVCGPLRLPGPDMEMDAPLDAKSAMIESAVGDAEIGHDMLGAGADAGAGMLPNDEKSYLSNDTISLAHSISRIPAAGVLVTRRQKVLKTPAGILTAMREKNMEKELLEMSERCINLQMALNEEKAVVDALTNKAGGFGKKRLAQEAITLREEVEKKTASLTAIAWKMNELNLINKTYNDKMTNREQHVMYLEEQLVELQNYNRRLIGDYVESEKRLRDEIDNLQRVVGGMTVPLWQFGEKSISDKPLASRIVVTSPGGECKEITEHKMRRHSIGQKEPDMEFPDFTGGELTFRRSSESEDSQDVGVVLPKESTQERAADGLPRRPKRRASDRLKMTVNKLRILSNLSRFSAAKGDGGSASKPILESINSQPEYKIPTGLGLNYGDISRSSDIESIKHIIETINAGTQTEQEEEPLKLECATQTDEVQIFESNVAVILAESDPRVLSCDAVVQTDEVQVFEVGALVRVEQQAETQDQETQTDETHKNELSLPVLVDSNFAICWDELPKNLTQGQNVVVNKEDLSRTETHQSMKGIGPGNVVFVDNLNEHLESDTMDARHDEIDLDGASIDDGLLIADGKGEERIKNIGQNVQSDPAPPGNRVVDIVDVEEQNCSEAGSHHSNNLLDPYDVEYKREREGHSVSDGEPDIGETDASQPQDFVIDDTVDVGVIDDDDDDDDDDGQQLEIGDDKNRIISRGLNTAENDILEVADEFSYLDGGQHVNDIDENAFMIRPRLKGNQHEGEGSSLQDFHGLEETRVILDSERPQERYSKDNVAVDETETVGLNNQSDVTQGATADEGKDITTNAGFEASALSVRADPVKNSLLERDIVGIHSEIQNHPIETSISPKSPINRFMPGEQTTRATSRFMPESDIQRSANRTSRRLMVGDDRVTPNSSSHRRYATSTRESFGSFEEAGGYDELGLRWGLTDDEIAADTAVLNAAREESPPPQQSDDAGKVKNQELDKEEELSQGSVDAEERDLFDNDFHERRSSHGPEKGSSNSSVRTEDDKAVQDDMKAIHDDDFEKMMGETTAALAAADARLVPDRRTALIENAEESDRKSDNNVEEHRRGDLNESNHATAEAPEAFVGNLFGTVDIVQPLTDKHPDNADMTDDPVFVSRDLQPSVATLEARPRDERKKKSRRPSRSPTRRSRRHETTDDDEGHRRRRKSRAIRTAEGVTDGDLPRSRSTRRIAEDHGEPPSPIEYSRKSSRHLVDSMKRVHKSSRTHHGDHDDSRRRREQTLTDSADFEREVRRRVDAASSSDPVELGSDSRLRRRSSRHPSLGEDDRHRRREHRHKYNHDPKSTVDNNGGVAGSDERQRRTSRDEATEETSDVRRRSSRRSSEGEEKLDDSRERHRQKTKSRASDDSVNAVRGERLRRSSSRRHAEGGDGAEPRREKNRQIITEGRSGSGSRPLHGNEATGNPNDDSVAGERTHRSRRHRDNNVEAEFVEELDQRGHGEGRRRRKSVSALPLSPS